MKFTCEKYILQNAITIAMRAVASKSPIQHLEGLLIEAGMKVRITGFDLKEGIYTSIDADVAQAGSIVVEAKLFSEMIRRLPDGMVTITTDNNLSVNVKCGKSEYNFIGLNAEDFPELPNVEGINYITLPQNMLKSMINQTIFAVSDSETRPVYTGELFEIDNSTLTIVAVDGYRLAKRTEKIDGELENCTFIVPGTALADVERICGDEEDAVEIVVGAKHISFVIGSTVLVSRRLEGDFLNYRKSIPSEFKYVLGISRQELISAIDRVTIVVTEKNNSPVRMTVNDFYIDLLCNSGISRAEDVCGCEGTGEGLEIGFNGRYMKDALKAAGVDKLDLKLNTPNSPCVIKANNGDESFEYMILPVRLRAD